MIVETLLILAFTTAGAFPLLALGFRGWPLLPLGFVTGLAMLAVAGFAHAFVGAPISPLVPIAVILAAALAVWLYGWRTGTAVLPSPRLVGLSLLVLSGGVVLFWHVNLVKYHYDSLRYLMASSLLHGGELESLSGNLLNKRFSGLTVIHSTSNFSGEFYLRAVTPFLSLAVLALLVWVVYEALHRQRSRALTIGAAALGVLLLLTNRNFLWHSFYINAHLLFGVQFMVVVALGWLAATRDGFASSRAFVAVQCVAVAGAVLARPEGLFLVGTALLPLVLSGRISAEHKIAAVTSLGLAILLEQGFIARYSYILGGHPSRDTFRLLLLGAAVLFVAVLLMYRPLRELLARFDRWILGLVEIGLWALLALYWTRDPDLLENSVDALTENLTTAAGGWGPAILTLAGLLVVAVWFKFPSDAYLRFPVTTFVPWVLLFAYLREGAYRTGLTDSANRILFQVVPLAVLYVVVAMALGRRRFARRSEEEPSDAEPSDAELSTVPPAPA